jgi:hypothetical protein
MFHQSSQVFRLQELVNPLVELRNTDIVPSAEVQAPIMTAIVNLEVFIHQEIWPIARRKWKKLTKFPSVLFWARLERREHCSTDSGHLRSGETGHWPSKVPMAGY